MPDESQVQPVAFNCEGGLVLNRSTFMMKAGEALELQNFEPDVEGGYRRINGFRKYINHELPSSSSSTESVLLSATFGNNVIAARGTVVYSSASTELASAIASDTTMSGSGTITVDSTSGFSSTGTIKINSEIFTYTGKTSTTLTGVTRATGGTTAVAHASGVQVAQFDNGGIPKYVTRTLDNNYILYPFPTKSYSLKFDYFTFPTDLTAHGDTTTIPDRFAAVIVDGATAFVYQYRGEMQQYGVTFTRFEAGIKHMQTLLVNRYDYLRSTYIPQSSNYIGSRTSTRII